MPHTSFFAYRTLLVVFLCLAAPLLPVTTAMAQPCEPNGDTNGDTNVTPADALQALRAVVRLRDLTPCARMRANVVAPESEALTAADAVCIFQLFLGRVNCLENTLPTVNTTGDQFIRRQADGSLPLVTLDGRRSVDPDGEALTYRWTYMAVPPDSTLTDAALSAPMAAVTTFVPDVIGVYQLRLTLTDARDGAASDTVRVSVQEAPDDLALSTCQCTGAPGDTVMLSALLTDAAGQPVPNWQVMYDVTQGDGDFLAAATMLRGLNVDTSALVEEAPTTIAVLTDANGLATVAFRLGAEPRQVVTAQAEALPNDPVIFTITLGPLVGNGLQPLNLAVGGGRGYTANSRDTISVFDTTGQSFDVTAVIDLTTIVPTEFGEGSILGVAVDAAAERLYVYALVSTEPGESVVVMAVDITTHALVEPLDAEGDGLPGLTLFNTPAPSPPAVVALAPSSVLGTSFGNLLTVDPARRRVYAVAPGVIQLDAEENPVASENGQLVVIDASSDTLTEIAQVPVGDIPTGVAVNTRTNRIYVTNKGLIEDDTINDTVSVIAGGDRTLVDTITVGRTPLGLRVDEVHNTIYVANLFGAAMLESSGAVSVIDGATGTVFHVPTSGTTDLALLVGAETTLLDTTITRVYANDGTVLDCDVTNLQVPEACQIRQDLTGLMGKLAVNESHTRLFGASQFDNAVAVLDVTANAIVGEVRTGVAVSGLAVDPVTGVIYVSDFGGDNLFTVDPDGTVIRTDLLTHGFHNPGPLAVNGTTGHLYVINPNTAGGPGTPPPLLVLARGAPEPQLLATLEPTAWTYKNPRLLAIDPRQELLYLTTASNTLVVLDSTRLNGTTSVSTALLAAVPVGTQEGPDLAQAVLVDTARNLVYVTRCNVGPQGCDEESALVVLRGAEIDTDTRALVQAPEQVAVIAGIGLQVLLPPESVTREMALDPTRNLLYITGAPGALVGSAGFGNNAITVVDSLRIIDAQGQVMPNPAEAVLGILPITVLPDSAGALPVPIVGDYTSRELALNDTAGLLYVVTLSSVGFLEGFLSVINSALVINESRALTRIPHPDVPDHIPSSQALIATIPAGPEPTFVAADTVSNRVIVTNQARGALAVLRGLTVQ